MPKIISERCELVQLCDINYSGPVCRDTCSLKLEWQVGLPGGGNKFEDMFVGFDRINERNAYSWPAAALMRQELVSINETTH